MATDTVFIQNVHVHYDLEEKKFSNFNDENQFYKIDNRKMIWTVIKPHYYYNIMFKKNSLWFLHIYALLLLLTNKMDYFLRSGLDRRPHKRKVGYSNMSKKFSIRVINPKQTKKQTIFCVFVCLGFIVPLENLTLIWKR